MCIHIKFPLKSLHLSHEKSISNFVHVVIILRLRVYGLYKLVEGGF